MQSNDLWNFNNLREPPKVKPGQVVSFQKSDFQQVKISKCLDKIKFKKCGASKLVFQLSYLVCSSRVYYQIYFDHLIKYLGKIILT